LESFQGQPGQRARPIVTRVIHFFWGLISWGAVLGLFLVVALGLLWYHRADDEIRRAAERLLARSLPHLSVTVRSARYLQGIGIELKGVAVRPRMGPTEPSSAILIERVRICCTPTLQELLRQEVKVDSIRIQQVTLRTTRKASGEWGFADLFPTETCPTKIPTILVEAGTLEVIDESKSPSGLWQIRGIEARIEEQAPSNPSKPPSALPSLQFAVSLGHEPWRQFIITGEYQPNGNWSTAGQVLNLALSPSLRTMLPAEWLKFERFLGPFQADADLSFSAHGGRGIPMDYQVTGKIRNGRMDDPRLTHPITDVQAEFDWDASGLRAPRVTARYGAAVVSCALLHPVQNGGTDLTLQGSLIGMHIDEKLFAYLPPIARASWEKFRPIGLVDIEFRLDRKQATWIPDISVTCKDLSFVWQRFPYPVEDVQGTIRILGNQALFALRSETESKPAELRGEMRLDPDWVDADAFSIPIPPANENSPAGTNLAASPAIPWSGWFELRSLRPCELDPALVRALSPKTQEVIQAFQPQGHFVMTGQWTKPAIDKAVDRSISIEVLDGNIRHAAFPYPLTEVRGRIEGRNDVWQFRDASARNDSGYFSGEGELETRAEGRVLQMRVEGTDVPLEDELRAALNPGSQAVWQHLQPRGSIDHVRVEFSRNFTTGRSSISAVARKSPARLDSERRMLQIKPRSFPYDLQDVSGRVAYNNGKFQAQHVRAQHANVTVALDAEGSVNNEAWEILLNDLHVDQLHPDTEFLGALPTKLREIIVRHQATGSVCLRGFLGFRGRVGAEQPDHSSWNVVVDMEDGQLQCGVPLKHVCGELKIVGSAVQDQFQCQGELDIDSLRLKQFHITQVRGPISGNAEQLLLGRWAAADPTSPAARPIVAKVNDGFLSLDGLCRNDQPGSFDLACSLDKINVASLTRDLLPGSSPIRGMLTSQCRIRGNALGRHTLAGEGSVQLKNTDLYQLPVVLALVQHIRRGKKDPSAFDSSDISFRVQGEHIYLDRIDLRGDALTLKGAGELNTRHELELNFYTMLGREDAYLPAVRPLLGLASQRFLLVKVTGTLEEPRTSREILPELNETLQRIFPDASPPQVPNTDILPANWTTNSPSRK
jgi:AsmA-like C-terminal region